jgi:hypothetical protein
MEILMAVSRSRQAGGWVGRRNAYATMTTSSPKQELLW